MAETEADEVRARIRARRNELGLTQKALARCVGVSYQQIQKYESGTDRLSVSMLVRIAKHLGCSASMLMGEAPQPGAMDEGRVLAEPDARKVLQLYAGLRNDEMRLSLLCFVKQLVADQPPDAEA